MKESLLISQSLPLEFPNLIGGIQFFFLFINCEPDLGLFIYT